MKKYFAALIASLTVLVLNLTVLAATPTPVGVLDPSHFTTFQSKVEADVGIILPVGLALMGLIVAITLIPKVIKRFTR